MGKRLAAAAVLLGLAAVGTGQPAGLSPGYEAVVLRYRGGDRDGAVAAVAQLEERELRDELEALRRLSRRARACRVCEATVTWRRTPVAAAVMLHTDCSRQRPPDGSTRLHESIAGGLARLLADDAERRDFARRWYAVMAGLAVVESRFEEGLRWAERGLRAFPDSAQLSLVKGSIHETAGLEAAALQLAAAADPSPSRMHLNLDLRQELRQHLVRARQALRDATAAQPSLDEAWLRLGRVCWRLGDHAEARAALEGVLSRTLARDTTYLAHLLLGGLHEEADRLDQAVRSYESAAALVADSQAARIALSHARLRLGDATGARRELEAGLAPAGRRPRPDPFWDYPWGPAVGVEGRLEALRREASS